MIGPTFGTELERAGLSGLPIAWLPTGEITGKDDLSAQQKALLDLVLAVHDPRLTPVPSGVTPLQMRRALRQSGMRDQVEAYVLTLDPDSKDAWEWASVIERNNPIIVTGAVALGLSRDEMDDLFRLAGTL